MSDTSILRPSGILPRSHGVTRGHGFPRPEQKGQILRHHRKARAGGGELLRLHLQHVGQEPAGGPLPHGRLIVPNVTNAFFSQLAYSIETELFQRNYSVFICNSGTDADKERDYFRTLIGKCVDGILCISDLNEIPSDILDRGVPIVCIDRRPVVDRVVPWVGNDDRAAAFNATELLIRKGCRHILFISSHHSAYTRFDRDKGYRQALEAHGIPADENYSMRRPGIDPTPIETEVMVYDFVQKGLPLDGIIASSEPAALGTLYASSGPGCGCRRM